jgi:hypothetical protein
MTGSKLFEVLGSFVELIMEHPIRTAFIVFLSTIFIAISSLIGGVWQVAFSGLFILILAIIMFVDWD